MAAFSANTSVLSAAKLLTVLTLPLPSFPGLKPASQNSFSPRQQRSILGFSSAAAIHPTVSAADQDIHDFIASSWEEFAENVSGEWDGFGAYFAADGKPIELPESVVPEAYREWEVKVFDWQTQCPTLAQSHDDRPSLVYKTIKLLPTVGCEADAATRYDIQERNVCAGQESPFAYQSTGCYVALWPTIANQVNEANKLMEVEHCLIHPSDKDSRVRIILVLESQEFEWKLHGVRVFVEQWYGPFRDGDQFGGCAIRDSAFAATPPLEASQVSGVWEGLTAVANFRTCHHMIQQLGDGCVRKSIRDEGDLVLLPKQLWCSLRTVEDKETCCEVGWLLDEGRAITSKCTFSSTAELKVFLSHPFDALSTYQLIVPLFSSRHKTSLALAFFSIYLILRLGVVNLLMLMVLLIRPRSEIPLQEIVVATETAMPA